MKELFKDIKEELIDLICDCGIFSLIIIPLFLILCFFAIPIVLLYSIFVFVNNWIKFKCKLLFKRYD